jgi:hypothetical protein
MGRNTKHIFASCTTKQAKIMQVLRLSLKSSGTDSWHHRNGYQHALKTEGLHSKEHGQIMRLTHIFNYTLKHI